MTLQVDAPPVVLCGAEKYDCVCYEPSGHDEPHICRCAGSWMSDGTIIGLPQGRSLFDFLSGDWGEPGAFPDPKEIS